MTSTYELLEAKRGEFITFESTVIRPLLGLNEKEMDQLGHVEIAKRIADDEIRTRFCELAIAMLDANIAHYRPDATSVSVQSYRNTAVIVSTLIIAAITQHRSGTATALFASALWYWLADETSRRRQKQLTADAEAHNEGVAGWAETLKEWEAERDELLLL